MAMPMMTGYQRDPNAPQAPQGMMDQEDLQEAPETPGEVPDAEDLAEGPETEQSDTLNAQSYGPSQGRTGADVIAACLAQPTLRTGNPNAQAVGIPKRAGTTGVQGQMDYGTDPGYGA